MCHVIKFRLTKTRGSAFFADSVGTHPCSMASLRSCLLLPLSASIMDDAALADLHELSGAREDDLFNVVVLFDHLSLLPDHRALTDAISRRRIA